MPSAKTVGNGTRRRWAIIAGVVAIVGIMFGTLAWVYADRMAVEGGIKDNAAVTVELSVILKGHGKNLEDHEGRIRSMEGVLRDVARDVKWIRGDMEEEP